VAETTHSLDGEKPVLELPCFRGLPQSRLQAIRGPAVTAVAGIESAARDPVMPWRRGDARRRHVPGSQSMPSRFARGPRNALDMTGKGRIESWRPTACSMTSRASWRARCPGVRPSGGFSAQSPPQPAFRRSGPILPVPRSVSPTTMALVPPVISSAGSLLTSTIAQSVASSI
jgi:hypothetical protein